MASPSLPPSFVRPSPSLLFVLFQSPSSLLRRRRRRIRDTVMAIQIYEGRTLRKHEEEEEEEEEEQDRAILSCAIVQ